ncbi:hypothetical protein BC834DRAFT_975363 [Gloeopeniophorella convolvens]|nr:hypothetical protein BC834DRAFT_975363 [Gloeopeniophorella convolvens]
MSFLSEAPYYNPSKGPFPRLIAPGIVLGSVERMAAGDPNYTFLGLTHVLTRPGDILSCPRTLSLLVIDERKTLRDVVDMLVHVRNTQRACVLVTEPYVAAAYLLAAERRDLFGAWRLVAGEELTQQVFGGVHAVLGQFARDCYEESRRKERTQGQQRQVKSKE